MFEQIFKNIDNILYTDSGSNGELDYIEQTSWIIFLRYLDYLEQERADQATLKGQTYNFILDEKSYEEISEILDCPVNTVRTWLHRSKELIRKELHGQIR